MMLRRESIDYILVRNNVICTVESRDYAPPPFVHASIGQNQGGGLYAGCVTTITDHRMPRGSMISALSLALFERLCTLS